MKGHHLFSQGTFLLGIYLYVRVKLFPLVLDPGR